MPFNGSGVYVPPSSPGAFNPAISGSSATPTAWNTLLDDIATALSTTIAKDGQSTPTANISMGSNKITNVDDGTVATDAATYGQILAVHLTGDIKWSVRSSVPTGWILAWGTIGDATSAATNRANADTVTLFTLLWNDWADGQAPVSGGRGANAAADYAAHKTIGVPDLRGRLLAGKDNMGGSAASRLTSTTMNPDGNTLGATGGTQTHTLITGEMPAHIHTLSISDAGVGGTGGGALTAVGGASDTTSTGGSGAHLNVQPAIIMNVFIKL